MLIFSRETWFEALWFLNASDEAHNRLRSDAGGVCDVLGALYRPMEGGAWTLKYRFRYGTRQSKAEDDARSWTEFTLKECAAKEALPKVREIFELMKMTLPAAWMEEILVQGNGDLAAHLLSQRSWAHLSAASKPPS